MSQNHAKQLWSSSKPRKPADKTPKTGTGYNNKQAVQYKCSNKRDIVQTKGTVHQCNSNTKTHERSTTEVKASPGGIHVKISTERVHYTNEHKKSSTVKIGEYHTEQKVRRVNIGNKNNSSSSTGSGRKAIKDCKKY